MEITDSEVACKLRLSSKRLDSGMVQVRFEVISSENGGKYGYLLAKPKTSLREVVEKILINISQMKDPVRLQSHLLNIGMLPQRNDMLIF